MMASGEKPAANLPHSSVILRRGESAQPFVVHQVQRLGVSRFTQLFDKGAEQKMSFKTAATDIRTPAGKEKN